MATHQAHRLPWTTLADVYADVQSDNGGQRYRPTEQSEKKTRHLARCLVSALQDFQVSDQRPPEDAEGHSLDPSTWGLDPTAGLGYTGFYYSLLRGYVELNLLLLDGDKFLSILQRGSERAKHCVLLLCGHMDGGHPEWMAGHLAPVMSEEDAFKMKPLTAEVLQRIRDHCALLFRCLNSISG